MGVQPEAQTRLLVRWWRTFRLKRRGYLSIQRRTVAFYLQAASPNLDGCELRPHHEHESGTPSSRYCYLVYRIGCGCDRASSDHPASRRIAHQRPSLFFRPYQLCRIRSGELLRPKRFCPRLTLRRRESPRIADLPQINSVRSSVKRPFTSGACRFLSIDVEAGCPSSGEIDAAQVWRRSL